MQNKLISIGILGMTRCYLNISTKEAIQRYCKYMDILIEEFDHDELKVFYFNEEFGAYSVYPIEDHI